MKFNVPIISGSPIKVIGVGGGGSNAVNYMHQQGIAGVDFIVCNTDNQALEASDVPVRIQLGKTLTAGQGAGAIPETGKNAAIENLDDVLEQLGDNTTMVFVTAGMGGGTGTGAAPVIAKACKELGILTVGIVTVPFNFEGRRRATQAGEGLEQMRASVDTLLVIRNDKLRELYGNLALRKAFANADEVLCTAAKGIAEVITLTGDINVDMNDVKTVMRDSGAAIMGAGSANGEGRAQLAVSEALESPLLNDNDIKGANFVLLNITYGSEEILMDEISEITDYIQDQAGATAEVIWGYGHDESLEDKICVTVIATGFEAKAKLPEGPVIKTHTLDDGAREITAPLNGPMSGPQPIIENVHMDETDEEPRLKTADSPSPTNEAEDFDALLHEAEDVTSVSPQSATDLFGPVNSQDGDQVSLVIKEEERPLTATPIDAPQQEEPLEAPIASEVEKIGDFTVLNLDDANEDPLLPEDQDGISFTQEEIDTETVNAEVNVPDHGGLPAEAQAQPVPSPQPEPKTTTPQREAPSRLDNADQAQRNAQRMQSIEALTKRLRTPSGLTELENEPAYKRSNFQFNETPSSADSQASRVSIDEETGGLKTDNPFLHDNVD